MSDLKLAQNRDSTIDLNPNTKELDLNPELVAKQLAAPANSNSCFAALVVSDRISD